MKLTTSGKIQVDDTGIRVMLDYDFGRYYKWLIDRWFFQTRDLFLPKHGIHVTIMSDKLHGWKFVSNRDRLKKVYHGRKIDIEYDNNFHEGGSDFTNYILFCRISLGDDIRRSCGVIIDPRHMSYHITVANDKSTARPVEISRQRNQALAARRKVLGAAK